MGRAPFLASTGEARIGRYELTLGVVADLRGPPQPDLRTLTVSSAEGLAEGDAIELRNEYQLARANFPAVQPCRIVAVDGDTLVLDRDAALPAFSQQGAHVLKATTLALDEFEVDEERGRAAPVFRAANDAVALSLELAPSAGGKRVDVRAERAFKTDLTVLSERVCISDLPPLAEAYRKNRKVDRGPAFQRDYNLDRQGALFGQGADSVYAYGVPGLSSLRLVHPASEFRVTPQTPSRPFPNDPAAAVSGELSAYASFDVPPEGGDVVVDLDLAGETAVAGVSLLWYHLDNRPAAVQILAQSSSGAWERFARWTPSGDATSATILMERELRTDRVRLQMSPQDGQRILALRLVDLLVGSEGFQLEAILDDHRDHRYCRFVAPDDRTDEMGRLFMESRSASRRRAGDVATSMFKLHIGEPPHVRPRVSHVPGGARALLAWTEHADRTTVDTHRAAYFGHSAAESPDEAVGGFVAAGIPVTKSVFADNPRATPCSRNHPQSQAAVRSDREFAALCEALSSLGHEICMHSPWPGNAPSAEAHEAAAFMAEKFNARTWIDHSAAVVHCGMSGQGLRHGSEYYMAETWAETGYAWFWQFACEDASEQRVGSINLQQIALGDRLHTPLWWLHPTETGHFRSWASIRGGDLDVYTDAAIAALVADRGVCVTHTYPAALYDDPVRNQYLTAEGASWRSSDEFEAVLQRFTTRVDSGELRAVTIREAMTYWEAIEMIDVSVQEDGCVVLANHSPSDITEFTVIVEGDVALDAELGATTSCRDEDTYVTFGFAAATAVRLDAADGIVGIEPAALQPAK